MIGVVTKSRGARERGMSVVISCRFHETHTAAQQISIPITLSQSGHRLLNVNMHRAHATLPHPLPCPKDIAGSWHEYYLMVLLSSPSVWVDLDTNKQLTAPLTLLISIFL